MSEPRVITDPGTALRYALAGRATLTLRSARTDAHFTYRVSRAEDDAKWGGPAYFVKLLTAPDVYTYLGMIRGGVFDLTKSSPGGPGAPSVLAFKFFLSRATEGRIPAGLEVRHEGRCGCCGRELTAPESIDRGIGPECWARLGRAA